MIAHCNTIAKAEDITQRQGYVRVSKQLVRDPYHASYAISKKLETIAGRLLRELERKLPQDKLHHYKEQLDLYARVIAQKRHDTDKIYSLHKPFTSCIAKGNAHKQ